MLLYLFSLISTLLTDPGTATMQIQIDDIRSDKGRISVAAYRPSDEFLGDEPYKTFVFKAKSPSLTVNIDLPKGTYGIAILHDENSDEEMNYNFVGIPKEAYGISRNAADGLTKPAFEDAQIQLYKPVKIIIDLVHW